MSPVRLERVTEANSSDLPAYASERVALEEGGPLLAEAVENPDAYLDHVRRFAEGIDLPSNRVQGFEYWLLAGERILGNCRIRPELIPEIELDREVAVRDNYRVLRHRAPDLRSSTRIIIKLEGNLVRSIRGATHLRDKSLVHESRPDWCTNWCTIGAAKPAVTTIASPIINRLATVPSIRILNCLTSSLLLKLVTNA